MTLCLEIINYNLIVRLFRIDIGAPQYRKIFSNTLIMRKMYDTKKDKTVSNFIFLLYDNN